MMALMLAACQAGTVRADNPEDRPVTKSTTARGTDGGALDDWPRVLGALAVVVALILLARYFLRRAGGTKRTGAKGGPVETLWRTSLSMKHQLFLIRAGRRVLFVGAGPQGVTTLCELTDPQEIGELLASIEQEMGDSFMAELAKQKGRLAEKETSSAVRSLAEKIRAQADQEEQENKK